MGNDNSIRISGGHNSGNFIHAQLVISRVEYMPLDILVEQMNRMVKKLKDTSAYLSKIEPKTQGETLERNYFIPQDVFDMFQKVNAIETWTIYPTE